MPSHTWLDGQFEGLEEQWFQGRGFGRKVLKLVMTHARTRPGADAFHTSYVAGEQAPRDFYLSFGFRPTGIPKETGEIDLVFDLGRR